MPKQIDGAPGAPIPAQLAETAPPPPKVSFGLSTAIGILGVLGVILGGIEGNDAVTAVSGASTLIMMLGRYGQAIVLARTVARAVRPWVGAIADLPDPR